MDDIISPQPDSDQSLASLSLPYFSLSQFARRATIILLVFFSLLAYFAVSLVFPTSYHSYEQPYVGLAFLFLYVYYAGYLGGIWLLQCIVLIISKLWWACVLYTLLTLGLLIIPWFSFTENAFIRWIIFLYVVFLLVVWITLSLYLVRSKKLLSGRNTLWRWIWIGLMVGVILSATAFYRYALYKNDNPTISKSSAWKTATNKELALSFQYPPEWTYGPILDEENPYIRIIEGAGSEISIKSEKGGDYNFTLAKKRTTKDPLYPNQKEIPVIIDGISGEEFVATDGREKSPALMRIDTYFNWNNRVLDISYEGTKSVAYQGIYEKVLHSITFNKTVAANTTPTPWTRYENPTYHIAFDQPPLASAAISVLQAPPHQYNLGGDITEQYTRILFSFVYEGDGTCNVSLSPMTYDAAQNYLRSGKITFAKKFDETPLVSTALPGILFLNKDNGNLSEYFVYNNNGTAVVADCFSDTSVTKQQINERFGKSIRILP